MAPSTEDCTNGVDPAWVGSGDWAMSGHIAMGWARSPRGPWSEPRIVLRNDLDRAKNRSDWDYYVTNPSASVMPNGTVMLVRPRPLRLGVGLLRFCLLLLWHQLPPCPHT